MPLCFAYGSNMDRDQMAARCPGSRLIGPGRLPRHRLVVMREGYLSIARDPWRDVLGLLWDLALADVPALDRYEGTSTRLYAKRSAHILTTSGARRALIYVGSNVGPGIPKPDYLMAVVSAARAADLPDAYCTGIVALGGQPSQQSRDTTIVPRRPAVRPIWARPGDTQTLDRAAGWRWEP